LETINLSVQDAVESLHLDELASARQPRPARLTEILLSSEEGAGEFHRPPFHAVFRFSIALGWSESAGASSANG